MCRLCVSECVCLHVNQGGTNRNRCAQRLVILHAQTAQTESNTISVHIYNGVWGGAPSGVQGQSPWLGSQGARPLKLSC